MTRYLSLAEFWFLAEHITGIDAPTLITASRVDLADSALHAPQAGFGIGAVPSAGYGAVSYIGLTHRPKSANRA